MADDKKEEKITHESKDEHKLVGHEAKPEEKPAEKKEEPDVEHEAPAKTSKLDAVRQRLLGNKKIFIPAVLAILLGLLFVIPFTRYAIAGLFLKQTFPVVVVDATTGKPIPSATVSLAGQKATTDTQGKAGLKVSVGEAMLSVSKQYYKPVAQEVLVPIEKPSSALTVKLEATGRQVPVAVLDKISGKGVNGATISVEGTQTKTDASGEAILVVPADKKELAASITVDGYNKTEVVLKVTEQKDEANTFKVLKSGTIYFLSNASGKIDLIKSDLDGANRKTVLAGTGKEDKYNTFLLASRDWKYIALLSKRDGGEYSKLFLVEAGTDKVTTMDEGDAYFSVLGWSGDRLVYKVERPKVKEWEPKKESIKSYHAPTKKITALIDSVGEGSQYNYIYEHIESAYVLDQEVVYSKVWYGYANGKQATLNSVQADGGQKKQLKAYPSSYIQSLPAEFGEVYVQYNENGTEKYDEYEGGTLSSIKLTSSEFYSNDYPRYAVSPSGKKTLWSEYRDGKYVFFVGDGEGKNGKQIGVSEDFTVYGWFSDEYLLLTRKGSEMRILPVDGLSGGVETSLKVSDYYKPNYTLRGYGYGYGG